jgi:nicotinate-nucleotide adenylyltransferase
MRIKMKKAGIFGGTFDPVHLGHLITARSVLEQRQLDKIIFMPCYVSPHKTDKTSSSPLHRLNMVKLAIENYEGFALSDYEIKKEGVSYTIDTIIELKKSFDEIELIIGYDSLVNFETWKEPDKLVELAKLIVMKRNNSDARTKEKTSRFFNRAIFVDTPVIDISSTLIRERIKNNLPADFLVPEKVLKYINENNLYK